MGPILPQPCNMSQQVYMGFTLRAKQGIKFFFFFGSGDWFLGLFFPSEGSVLTSFTLFIFYVGDPQTHGVMWRFQTPDQQVNTRFLPEDSYLLWSLFFLSEGSVLTSFTLFIFTSKALRHMVSCEGSYLGSQTGSYWLWRVLLAWLAEVLL